MRHVLALLRVADTGQQLHRGSLRVPRRLPVDRDRRLGDVPKRRHMIGRDETDFDTLWIRGSDFDGQINSLGRSGGAPMSLGVQTSFKTGEAC